VELVVVCQLLVELQVKLYKLPLNFKKIRQKPKLSVRISPANPLRLML
jgi:hypothetical protein